MADAGSADELKSFFSTTHAGMFPMPASGRVLTFEDTATLKEAFTRLVSENVLGAPVLDTAGKIVGMIDMLDLVDVILSGLGGTVTDTTTKHEYSKHFGEAMAGHMATTTVHTVINKSGRDPLVTVDADAPLGEVVRLLTRAHRVVVVNDKNQIVNMITQSAIVALLSAHLSRCGHSMQKSIQELQLASDHVVSVSNGSRALDAFMAISQKGVSAVAVFDEGKLLGTVSARDIRTICQSPEDTRLLFGSVHQLLARIHEGDYIDRFPALTVPPTATLADVVGKMSLLKIHRVWVQKEGDGVATLQVVTLTDVLRVLADEVESPC